MSRFEKIFVNAPRHAQSSIEFAERMFGHLELHPGWKYLEVGCGAGALSLYVADKYQFEVTGTDVDPDQIKLAQKAAEGEPRIRFLAEDTTDLSFEEGQFDMVVIYNVLHHVSDWRKALMEVHRVLKQGGYFIFCDLVFPQFLVKIARSFVRKYGVTTFEEINEFLIRVGFSAIHCSKSQAHLFRGIEGIFTKR